MMPPPMARSVAMPPSIRPPSAEAAGRQNMLLLIQLRWIAAAGQLATILLEPEKAKALRNATTVERVYALLTSDESEDD